jgi:polysaccharide deacetylase family protein (PEP-CTERM system associated)
MQESKSLQTEFHNALTFDMEDWRQLMHELMSGKWIEPSSSVVANTHRIFDLLDEAGIRATFFVQGKLAEGKPDLVKEAVRRGHEIASHTYSHLFIHQVDPAAFRADVEHSIRLLEDISGQPVIGFRAPDFSVGSVDHWCFRVLAELGFRYDSSVVPVNGIRYGIPGAPHQPFTIKTPSGDIREFPLATWEFGGFRISVAGGSHFRLLPGFLLARALATIDREGGTAVLYFHPHEFHRGLIYPRHFLRLSNRRKTMVVLRHTVLHNLCTGMIVRRLKPILAGRRFTTLGEIYRAQADVTPATVR